MPELQPIPDEVSYSFVGELARTMQSGRSRSIILSGQVQDLFFLRGKDGSPGRYVPIVPFLVDRFSFKDKVRIGGEDVSLSTLHLDLNDGIRFLNGCEAPLRDMFADWVDRARIPDSTSWANPKERRDQILQTLDRNLLEAQNNNTTALQILRRLVEASQVKGSKLLIFIQAADLLIPAGDGDVSRLPPPLVKRLAILEDWFSDPDFVAGKSTVVLLTDSLNAIHPRISRLPQLLEIPIPAPDRDARERFIRWYYASVNQEPGDLATLSEGTAGLSLHAVRQLLANHVQVDQNEPIPAADITRQVAAHMKAQLGDAVEFYRPPLREVRGNRRLKAYAQQELIPDLQLEGEDAISAIIAAGPIGCGKTHIFNWVAAHLECPILVLGNLRSQWYGGTDVILERLERVIHSMPRLLIVVDEADTAFGGVGKDVHETERRLTGKVQAIMSDPGLRGRVSWILMTARIDQLSPDMRRPGRADVIIPVLDPDAVDRLDFVTWLLEVLEDPAAITLEAVANLTELTGSYSPALYGAVRARARRARNRGRCNNLDDLIRIVKDSIEPDIAATRRYQELQALLNCTSASLLPEQYQDMPVNALRKQWLEEVMQIIRKDGP